MKRLIIFLIFCLFLIGNIFAFEFDNVKNYDSQTKTATIKNAFGLGEVIATAKLETDEIVYVIPGENRKVAEITINLNKDEYKNFLEKIDLINNKNSKAIQREITLKYKVVEEYEIDVPVFEEECNNIKGNSTCKQILKGNKKEKRNKEIWKPLEKLELKKGKITIGLFTDVYKGDNVEWIPVMFGNKIEEWATWTDSLNIGLVSGYNMEEDSGTLIIDRVNLQNNTMIMETENRTTGIIGKGVGFQTNKKAINNTPLGFQTGNQNITVSFWAKRTGTGKGLFTLGEGGEGTYLFIAQDIVSYGGGANDLSLSIMSSANTWYHIVLITNTAGGGNITVWQDGVYNAGKVNAAPNFNFNKIAIGYSGGVGYYMTGVMDEVYIWNRTLSTDEITQLYNGGSGITYVATQIFSISSSLSSPINYFNTTNSTVNFSSTTTVVAGNVTNMTLYLWGTTTTTNLTSGLSGLTNTSSWIMSGLADGTYLWNVKSCGQNSTFHNCTFASSNRTFTIDSTPPVIAINSGNGTVGYGDLSTNHTLNFTATDSLLSSCWIDYNGTNYTRACTSGASAVQSFALQNNIYRAIIWANDSLGNKNSLAVNWTYNLFFVNETYSSPVLEITTSTFTANFIVGDSPITQAYLRYNNTNYLGTITLTGNNYTVTRVQVSPDVSAQTNISFYWIITNALGNYNTTTHNQTVNPILVDINCTDKSVIFNFTLVDEKTKVKINPTDENTTIKVDMKVYTINRDFTTTSFNNSFNRTNSAAICLNSDLTDGSKFSIDAQIQYTALNHTIEMYNIWNYTLKQSTLYNNITLYNLDDVNAQEFKILAKSSTYLPLANALIQIERKYLEDGDYKITEIPKTDESGITTASLELNDVIYTFKVYQNKTLVYQFSDMNAICQTPLVSTCEIDLYAVSSNILIPDYQTSDDFNYTIDYNRTSRVIVSNFLIPSGNPANIQLLVYSTDALKTTACTDSLNSSIGTLTCTVPSNFGNATVMAYLFKDGVEKGKGSVSLANKAKDIYGYVLVFLSVLVMMTFIGISISDNPIVTILLLLVGAILVYSMNLVDSTGFIGASATILFLIIAFIIVLIKISRRN